MFEINEKNAKQWSRLGSRGVFGQAILELSRETKKDLMVLSADLGSSSGLSRFINEFPDRFVNAGISEQNMIGMAAGLAKEGSVVFATSFAPFISMRASEQIRMNMGYMNFNVKAVAIGSGVAMGFLGNSHYGIEDSAIMRSVPNLTVVCPADCSEIYKTVFAASEFDGPMYIRLTGQVNNPPVYTEDYDFKIGKAVKLRDGNDVTIIANGTMVYESLQAAKFLEEKGIGTKIFNMHTIKPIDIDAINNACKTKLIVTIEEASIIGGLGGAVAEYKSTLNSAPPQLTLGLPDHFGAVGEHVYLLEKYGLVGEKIAERIIKRLENI